MKTPISYAEVLKQSTIIQTSSMALNISTILHINIMQQSYLHFHAESDTKILSATSTTSSVTSKIKKTKII